MNPIEKTQIIVLGESRVGKTSLIKRYIYQLRFTSNSFDSLYYPTVGIDYHAKTQEFEGRKIKVKFWDTVGEDKHKSVTEHFYNDTDGVIIVFDVTSKDSFSKIKDWVQSINDKAHKNVKFILIGNKIDGKREVSKEDGLNLAKKYGVNYYDVSTKSNTGINEAIKDLTSQILNSNNSNNSNNERKLNNVLVEDKQCCSIF